MRERQGTLRLVSVRVWGIVRERPSQWGLGPNLALFLPTEDHAIELRVPGGSPVSAQQGWDGDDELIAGGTALKIPFPRSDLIASIQAGLAGGQIPAAASEVQVTLVADGLVIGTTNVKLKSK